MKLSKYKLITLIFFLIRFSSISISQTDEQNVMEAKHALETMDDCKTAKKALDKCSEAYQEQALYIFYLAKTYDCMDDYSDAILYYNKYLKFVPDNATIIDKVKKLSEQASIEDEKRNKEDKDQKDYESKKLTSEQQLASFNNLAGKWTYKNIEGIKTEITIEVNKQFDHYELIINPAHKTYDEEQVQSDDGKTMITHNDLIAKSTFMYGFFSLPAKPFYIENNTIKGTLHYLDLSEIYPLFRGCNCHQFHTFQEEEETANALQEATETELKLHSTPMDVNISFTPDPNKLIIYMHKIKLTDKEKTRYKKKCTYEILDKTIFYPMIKLQKQ